MPSRVTSFCIADDLHKRISVAAAALDMSVSEYIRRALICNLAADVASDPMLAAAFAFFDERERSPEREAVTA
jgi:hypothetical protein